MTNFTDKLTFKMSSVKKECQMLFYYYDVFKALLVSSVGFEESNRSGVVPNWHPTPVLRLGPWPKAET